MNTEPQTVTCLYCGMPRPSMQTLEEHIKSCPSHPMLITVCDQCFRASCWQGVFYCDKSKTAGTVKKTRRELNEKRLEHPSWWKTDHEIAMSAGRVM